MNPKEILEKLRQTFSELTTTPVQPSSFTTATLKDGTPVEVTELAVGGVVTINGTPAPAGEHELSDGTVIVLGDNGTIMEIKPAMAPAPDNGANEIMNKFSAFEALTNEKFASYEQKFADYEAKLAKANQVIEGLLNLTQTLAETPTGAPDTSIKALTLFRMSQSANPIAFYSVKI